MDSQQLNSQHLNYNESRLESGVASKLIQSQIISDSNLPMTETHSIDNSPHMSKNRLFEKRKSHGDE